MHPGIYIHIPFCESKCGYCDFFSITDKNQTNDFLLALRSEIELYSQEISKDEIFDTIYIGGGTPSILSASQIAYVIELLNKNFKVSSNAEITIEVNPGTIDKNKLRAYKNAGINRVSIGVQSFNDKELKFLGRIHTVNQSLKSINEVKETEFNDLSIDLIYAIPGQEISTWESSLKEAVKINPEHISAYNLTIEKDTPFYDLRKSGKLKTLAENKEKEFFNITDSILSEAEYDHYEISNFSYGENYKSKHNSKYWKHVPYIGFGPAAHSFWLNQRRGNYKSVEKYVQSLKNQKKPIEFKENLQPNDLEFEHIFLSLRTYQGLDLQLFLNEFGYGFLEKYKSIISPLIDIKYAELNKNYFNLTKEGMALYDEIVPTFITH